MSLFPKEDFLSKEIESWERFEYVLRRKQNILFNKMMKECKREEYVNAKGKSFAVECLSMALIFQQQR